MARPASDKPSEKTSDKASDKTLGQKSRESTSGQRGPAQPASGEPGPSSTGASGTPAAERELRARGRRTMARLLDAGMQVLGERGFHATRVDDIVRVAETSHGTFYLYFADKEDLVRVLAEECVEEVTAAVSELGPVAADAAGRRQLREWLQRWSDAYRRYGPVVRVWMEDHVADPALLRLGGKAMEQITGVLEQRIRESSGSVAPADGALALLAMIERLFYYVLSRGISVDEDEMLDTLALMIHRGFFGGDGD